MTCGASGPGPGGGTDSAPASDGPLPPTNLSPRDSRSAALVPPELQWLLPALAMGLVLAMVTCAVVAAEHQRTRRAVATLDRGGESPRPPDPARGRLVFVAARCGDCHSVAGVASARGTLGPALDGLGTRAATRRQGMGADAYIRESVEQPGAFVVKGYLNVMPSDLRSSMSRRQYEDLVAWLETL